MTPPSDQAIAREILRVFAAHPGVLMSPGEIGSRVAEALGAYVSTKQVREHLRALVRARVISFERSPNRSRFYRTYDGPAGKGR